MGDPQGSIAPKFEGARAKSAGLAAERERVTTRLRCGFLDSGKAVLASGIDGIYLDAPEYRDVGLELAEWVSSWAHPHPDG
jgi:hypothetical protein